MLISNALRIYEAFINKMIVFLLSILIVVVFLQILGRYIPFIPHWLWTIEVSNFLLTWIVFLGSIIALKRGKHFFVDLFSSFKNALFDSFLKIVYYAVTLLVSLVFIFYGYQFVEFSIRQNSMILDINLGAVYVVIPFTGISWMIFLLHDIYSSYFNRTTTREQ